MSFFFPRVGFLSSTRVNKQTNIDALARISSVDSRDVWNYNQFGDAGRRRRASRCKRRFVGARRDVEKQDKDIATSFKTESSSFITTLSKLECDAVREAAETRHVKTVTLWRRWISRLGDVLADSTGVDVSVVSYMNESVSNGMPSNVGEQLIAGLGHLVPDFNGHGSVRLSRARRAPNDWRKHCVSRSQKLLVLRTWAGIIRELFSITFFGVQDCTLMRRETTL